MYGVWGSDSSAVNSCQPPNPTASTLHRVNAQFRTGMASIQPCMDPAGFVAHANHAKPVAERKQHLPRRIPPDMEFPGDKVNGAPVDTLPISGEQK